MSLLELSDDALVLVFRKLLQRPTFRYLPALISKTGLELAFCCRRLYTLFTTAVVRSARLSIQLGGEKAEIRGEALLHSFVGVLRKLCVLDFLELDLDLQNDERGQLLRVLTALRRDPQGLYINAICEQHNSDWVDAIAARCSRLKIFSLSMEGFHDYSDGTLVKACENLFAQATALESIVLARTTDCCGASEFAENATGFFFWMRAVRKGNPNLKELSLLKFPEIGINEVSTICEWFPNLHLLDLSEAVEFDDNCLDLIGQSLLNLTTLIISACPGLTDAGATRFLASPCVRKSLLKLDISLTGLSRTTLDAMHEHLNNPNTQLKHLNDYGCVE